MQELRQIDTVAYVRFASVYRSFQDVTEFMREVQELSKAQPEKGRSRENPARSAS
jgi:transcriptional repressor NrdR